MIGRLAGILMLAALAAGSPAAADDFSPRFSRMKIVGPPGDSQELVADGREDHWHPGHRVAGPQTWTLVLKSRLSWRPDTDVVVLGRLEISKLCVGRYQLVLVPRQGFPRAIKPSTSCANGIIAMRVSHRTIELDTAVRRPDLAHVTLRFDGDTMGEIEVPRDDSGAKIAGAGADVTRWAGVHPAAILDEG